jgi:glycosyltransferase involved in cell wall biosynthesis
MRRVAHVVSSLQIGGAERLVVDLAGAQLRSGLDAWIVDLGRSDGPLDAIARALGVRVVRIGRLRSHLARTAALAAILAGRDHPVHVHNPWALRSVLPILPTLRGRVVYTRHGASPYDRGAWRAIHWCARRFIDHVTFVTDEARASFETAHGASPERHVVIENGVMVEPKVPRRIPPARLRIGAVGRLVELKGQRYIIDAIAGLPPGVRARIELHLFGDGPERGRLADQARAALADTTVVFHGTVIDRERIYSAIDVLAMASRTEGQSMAIMEAMARGVPVIATKVGGNPQLVRDGVTGMLVPAGDSSAIRAAVARLLAEPELVVKFGRASHARIAARHSIDAVAHKYATLYACS